MADALEVIGQLEDQLAGASRDIAAWRLRYADLKRDKERDAEQHVHHAAIKSLFEFWQAKTSHPRCKFNHQRFEVAEPIFREYGDALCRRAIEGAAYDPFITKRRNGSVKRHDGWELIFRDRAKFEEFANRAPLDGTAGVPVRT